MNVLVLEFYVFTIVSKKTFFSKINLIFIEFDIRVMYTDFFSIYFRHFVVIQKLSTMEIRNIQLFFKLLLLFIFNVKT